MAGEEFKIIIIGGGLGGLTFALACFRHGIQFDLYEQAIAFGAVGAGVEIGPNAVQVLNKLGLEKQFETISSPFSERYMVHIRHSKILI
jgi:salicylate hydroxylase